MNTGLADPTACATCHSTDLVQDPDVLDYLVLVRACGRFPRWAGPNETPDLNYFYPTAVLETGYDILVFLGGAQ
jgi:valyl-tRNA synthetase